MQNDIKNSKNDENQEDKLVEKPSENTRTDRSFDTIADHFEKKVYGGLKGDIRLAVLRRDIFEYTEKMSKQLARPLRILDVGAGLAQIAIELAAQGHIVVVNDISANMLEKAQVSAAKVEKEIDITWYVCPYQELQEKLNAEDNDKFDLIMCHALLEWLAEPAAVMEFFDQQLTDNGTLSLCFYNPASFDYRNLIMGNFNLLDNTQYKADNKKSLTPNHPVAKEEVESWLATHHYQVVRTSGLRVFHDYSPLKRGGHNDPDAVIRMELRYSQLEPYKWLGRYLHILATR
ncbi:methyltransferase domain-containing protein [Psychrobacter sp. AOP22-C1-22]|uniref:methyltransferase domain-containing protein n=1 Tax=unclassified Psychrobacter TaxID=196806 RepID=UPI0017882C7F|nr:MULTISPECIES: methyltransferase domain-containing protein [unclassified Psychrobacter]MBE0407105.1 methyltransferase domain-containing protein [Psychrobacter sp. FME6]MBE0445222.1 methyltransferase domain-containing protein [Psychrobacter sp. FME5]MDN5801076.1 methyltransferase domain-containing protein [Psychrobacter sp.]MDN5891739.1 methyltransferase domain-containing protein [Psychrobacter sp.]